MSRPTSEGTVPWPSDIAAIYRRKGYWEDRSLYSHFSTAASQWPDKIALVDGNTRLSYSELRHRVDAASIRLSRLGLVSDDRILVQLPNSWQFVAFTLACFRIGCIPVMALPAHRQHELSYLAELSESVAIAVPDVLRDFDHQSLAATLRDESNTLRHIFVLGESVRAGNLSLDALLRPGTVSADEVVALDAMEPRGDNVACFLLSGGTTGLPKLIARTHNDYAYNIKATSAVAQVTDKTVYLGTLPASHNFPLACPGILGALFAGGTAVMLPSPEPSRAFATIAAEKVTLSAAVPAVVQRWIEHHEEHPSTQLASLELLQVGGSRLPDEIAVKVRPVLGPTLQQVFGMAEGLINTTRFSDPDEIICATQGRPVSEADEVRVVDEDGNDVPRGIPGSLLTRGPYTPRGYYRAEEHNTKSFTPDGWYSSGDIVVQRADGNLIVHGRDKDMINRGGEKISAEEVENLVYRLDEIDLAAAVSMPDPLLGERVCIFVTVRPGRTIDLPKIQERMHADGVAAFKIPERLVVVDDLPLTKVGKIDKKQLRADISRLIDSANQ